MLLFDFFEQFPDEETCKKHLRDSREILGVCCKKCKRYKHFWLESKEQWQCKNCDFRTTLKSGTIFQNTKMPLRVWFFTMGFMTFTKKGFSSKEIQSQVGHKRYEPIWYMMHKIRKCMGKSNDHLNDLYSNTGAAILEVLVGKKSEKKQITFQLNSSRKHVKKGGRVPLLHLKKSNSTSFSSQPGMVSWPTHPIKNLERILYGIHHRVKDKYLQNYLDEFSFKFSRRFSKHHAFHSLFYAAVQPYW